MRTSPRPTVSTKGKASLGAHILRCTSGLPQFYLCYWSWKAFQSHCAAYQAAEFKFSSITSESRSSSNNPYFKIGSFWDFYAIHRRLDEKKPLICQWYEAEMSSLFVQDSVFIETSRVSVPVNLFCCYLWTSVDAGECPTDIPKRLVTHQTLLLPQLQRDNDNLDAPVEEYDFSNCNHESFAFR